MDFEDIEQPTVADPIVDVQPLNLNGGSPGADIDASRSRVPRSIHLVALSDQAIVSGSNFLTNMVLARGLSLAGFGKYSLLWMSILFCASLQMAVITSPMMSIGPIQTRIKIERYIGCVFTAQLGFAFICTLLLAGLLGIFRFRDSTVTPRLILAVISTNLSYLIQDFTRRVFFYQQRVTAALITDCISYVGQLTLVGLLYRFRHVSVENVLWSNAFTSVLAFAVTAIYLPSPLVRSEFFLPVIRRNWQSARYLLAATLLQWTSGNFFVLIAPVFLGVSAVGAMRACQSIMNMTNVWMQGLENSLPSEASGILTSQGVPALRKYILRALAMLGGLTLLVVGVVITAPEFYLRIIYGSHLAGYGFVLRAFAILSLLTVVTLPLRAGLRSIEDTRPIFVGYILTTAYSILSAPLLARTFGLHGLMVGLIGTQVLLVPLLTVSLYRRLHTNDILVL
jgi:O-antigen/teichoic acid export membrane protein